MTDYEIYLDEGKKKGGWQPRVFRQQIILDSKKKQSSIKLKTKISDDTRIVADVTIKVLE